MKLKQKAIILLDKIFNFGTCMFDDNERLIENFYVEYEGLDGGYQSYKNAKKEAKQWGGWPVKHRLERGQS